MASLGDVSTDDLRQVLAEVEGKEPTQRVIAAINYLEENEATLGDVAGRYGYTAGWLPRWLDRLERLADEPFEEVVYDEHRSGRPSELSDEQHERFVEVLHISRKNKVPDSTSSIRSVRSTRTLSSPTDDCERSDLLPRMVRHSLLSK